MITPIRAWGSPTNNSRRQRKRHRQLHCRWPKNTRLHRKRHKRPEKPISEINWRYETNGFETKYGHPHHRKRTQETNDHELLRGSSDSFSIVSRSIPASRPKKLAQPRHSPIRKKEHSHLDRTHPLREIYVSQTKDRKHSSSKHRYADHLPKKRRHGKHRFKEDASQKDLLMKRIMAKKTRNLCFSTGHEEQVRNEKKRSSSLSNHVSHPRTRKNRRKTNKEILRIGFDKKNEIPHYTQALQNPNGSESGSLFVPIPKKKHKKTPKRFDLRPSVEDQSLEEYRHGRKWADSPISNKKCKKLPTEVTKPSAADGGAEHQASELDSPVSDEPKKEATTKKRKTKSEISSDKSGPEAARIRLEEKSNSSISEPPGREFAIEVIESLKESEDDFQKELREDKIRLEQRARLEREREKRRKEKKGEKLRNWLHEKTKEKHHNLTKVYESKENPGDYLTIEKDKTSLCLSILKAIRRLEQRYIPYPIAILKYMRKKHRHEDLTLVQLNRQLNWMSKNGFLKSDSIPGEKKIYFSVNMKKKPKRQRAAYLRSKKKDTSPDMSGRQANTLSPSGTMSDEVDNLEDEASSSDKVDHESKKRKITCSDEKRKGKIDAKLATLGAECKEESHTEIIRGQRQTLAKLRSRIKVLKNIQSAGTDNEEVVQQLLLLKKELEKIRSQQVVENDYAIRDRMPLSRCGNAGARDYASMRLENSLRLTEERKKDLESISNRIKSISNRLERKDYGMQNYEDLVNLREDGRNARRSPDLNVLLEEITAKSGENAQLREALRQTQERLRREQNSNTAKDDKTLRLDNANLCLPPSKYGDCLVSECGSERRFKRCSGKSVCATKKKLQNLKQKLRNQEEILHRAKASNMLHQSRCRRKYRSCCHSSSSTCCC